MHQLLYESSTCLHVHKEQKAVVRFLSNFFMEVETAALANYRCSEKYLGT